MRKLPCDCTLCSDNSGRMICVREKWKDKREFQGENLANNLKKLKHDHWMMMGSDSSIQIEALVRNTHLI